MTTDRYPPPEPTFDTRTLRARRAHLLDEISRADRSHAARAARAARSRSAALVGAFVLMALIPVAALAIANDWWFLRSGVSPTPASAVVVVKTGTWEGKDWQLTAYLSDTDGLCYALTPSGSSSAGASISCDSIEGVPRGPMSKPYMPHAVSYAIAGKDVLPASIYGPVTDKAVEVVAYFADGAVLRTPTVAAPTGLRAAVRFYVAMLPDSMPPAEAGQSALRKLVGLDGDGRIVACLTGSLPAKGVRLADCQ
jgi:hypothetical protein